MPVCVSFVNVERHKEFSCRNALQVDRYNTPTSTTYPTSSSDVNSGKSVIKTMFENLLGEYDTMFRLRRFRQMSNRDGATLLVELSNVSERTQEHIFCDSSDISRERVSLSYFEIIRLLLDSTWHILFRISDVYIINTMNNA